MRHLASASFLAFCLGSLVGYPAAAVMSEPGFAPKQGMWAIFAISITVVLIAYSALPKSLAWLRANCIVLPAMALLVLAVCYFINPEAVGKNVGMVIFFSVFTAAMPFWLPVIALVTHWVSCAALKSPNKGAGL